MCYFSSLDGNMLLSSKERHKIHIYTRSLTGLHLNIYIYFHVSRTETSHIEISNPTPTTAYKQSSTLSNQPTHPLKKTPPSFHIHLTQNPGLTLDRSTNANIAISRSIHPILAILSLRGFPTYSPSHGFRLVKYPCFDLFLPFACILVGILGFWILDVGDGDGDRELCTYLGCCRCLGHAYDA